MLSSYKVEGSKIRVKTAYCGMVVDQCRKWGGKFDKTSGVWELPVTRLGAIQEQLGVNQEDQVEVEVRAALEEQEARPDTDPRGARNHRPASAGYHISDNCYHLGWYVLASRRGRDHGADVYALLVDGEIPATGGSVKNPLVNGEKCAFRLWVPRDFALARGLTVVPQEPSDDGPEPTPEVVATNPLAAFTDEQIRVEFLRRNLTA
jgi:hypothetical protein